MKHSFAAGRKPPVDVEEPRDAIFAARDELVRRPVPIAARDKAPVRPKLRLVLLEQRRAHSHGPAVREHQIFAGAVPVHDGTAVPTPTSVDRRLPLRLHSLTTPSSPPDAIQRPSGFTDKHVTPPV
jgi:hypothetical protein